MTAHSSSDAISAPPAPTAPPSRRTLAQRARHSVAFTLFIAVFATYAYFYQGGGHNEAARFDTIRAFLDNGSFVVDRYAYNSADLIQVDGHYYSSKAPGTFYLGLPVFVVSNGVLRVLGVPEEPRYHWVCYFTTVFTVSLAAALTVVLMYWLGLRLKASRVDAAAVALTIGLGTIFFPFATLFFSHVVTAAFLFCGFYQVFAFVQETRASTRHWRLIAAGAALGFAITLEYPAAIGAVIIGLYALHVFFHRLERKRFWSYAIWFVGAGVLGLVPLFVYNIAAFHNPLYVTYEAYAQSGSSVFAAHKKGILGIRIPFLDPEETPLFLSNLKEILFKPLRGLFFANPVLLLMFAGATTLVRRKWRLRFDWPLEVIFALAIFAAYVAMNAGFGDSIVYWGGGASFGPRHLIVALPFLAILLHAALKLSWSRAVFAPLTALSAFSCLMATAIEPRTPYEPANPLFQYYLPRFLHGQLAQTNVGVFSNALMTSNSVGFNWGQLFYLMPMFQLVPLYLIWFGLAWWLDRQLEVKTRGFRYFALMYCLVAALLPIGAMS